MNIRYNNKIKMTLDVDDRLMDVLMPRMLLQPIVENAILHGFRIEDGCVIDITSVLQNGKMTISIKDNGYGIDENKLYSLKERLSKTDEEDGDGIENIALVNIKNRLSSHYGKNSNFCFKSGADVGTEVSLTIPVTQSGVAQV